MSSCLNGTRLSLTFINRHLNGSSMQNVFGDLMNKLWISAVVAVINNSSRDTPVAGWCSVIKDEGSLE